MTDLDAIIRTSLEQWAPQRNPDWADVLTRSGRGRSRRALVVAVVVAAALVVGVAALAQTLGHGFSDWLEGSPGAPASQEERDSLSKHSWAPLDPDVDVRQLLAASYAGRTYRLIGFRTGGSVCMRVVEAAVDEGGDVSCVPGDQLARSRDLAVPLAIDKALTDPGPGDAPGPQASFGLVAAETRNVVLDGDDGPHEARVGNGAFLLIGPGPTISHTTLRGYATDLHGHHRSIPVAPSLTGEIGQNRTGLPLLGPKAVERPVDGGAIGWLERREARGESVPDGLAKILLPHKRPPGLPANMPGPIGLDLEHGDFARLIQPDPADFMRIVVGQTTDGETCYYEAARGGVGGTCARRLFDRHPFSHGVTYAGTGSQFVLVAGIASDDVMRLDLFLGNGDVQRIGLLDNAFLSRVQRAKLPGRLVAYDADGRVIGLAAIRMT